MEVGDPITGVGGLIIHGAGRDRLTDDYDLG
jgi:hypothetical protein